MLGTPPQGIPVWDKVLGNPGTLRCGVSHHRGSQYGRGYLGIPGHLDVGYLTTGGSQDRIRYLGIPGHLDVGYPTTVDPRMG